MRKGSIALLNSVHFFGMQGPNMYQEKGSTCIVCRLAFAINVASCDPET